MNTDQTTFNNHPDEALLFGYLESPKSDEFLSVRRHLVHCPICRKEVAGIQSMIHLLRSTRTMIIEEPEGQHLDEITIADYVDKRLSFDQYSEIKRHMSGCDYCTRAVLHYSVNAVELEKDDFPPEDFAPSLSEPQHTKTGDGFALKLRRLFSWRMPIWVGVPATALAAVALFLLVTTEKRGGVQIISFQDRPEVVITSPKGNQPGIGFIGSGRERSVPFEGMNIHTEDKTHLRLKWSKIENALRYEVKIYSTIGEERTLIGQTEPSELTNVTIQVPVLTPGKRYAWEISGETADGNRFLAQGGFVVGGQRNSG